MNKTIALLALICAASAMARAAAPDERQAHIDKTFAAMDANGDGRVDKAEYARFQQARFRHQTQSVDAAFGKLDTDKDGWLSKAEAAAVPAFARYFDALDADKDGRLSREEMQQAILAAQTADATDTTKTAQSPKK